MKKLIRLNESEFNILIRKIISEVSDHSKNLYISWAKSKSGNYEKAIKYMDDYFKYRNKLSKKDFIQYSSADELESEILKIKEKEVTKEKEQSVDKIYEDNNLLVVAAKSWESSCKYGAGTKWCTAAKEYKGYWDRHQNTGTEFIWINKNIENNDPRYKFSLHIKFDGDYSDWCDAVNNCSNNSPYTSKKDDKRIYLKNYEDVFNKCVEYHNIRLENYNEGLGKIKTIVKKIESSLYKLSNNEESDYYKIIISYYPSDEEFKDIVRREFVDDLDDIISNNYKLDTLEDIIDDDREFKSVYDDISDDIFSKIDEMESEFIKNKFNYYEEIFEHINDNIIRAIVKGFYSENVVKFLNDLENDWDGTMENILNYLSYEADVEETVKEISLDKSVRDFETDLISFVDDLLEDKINEYS